MYAIRSYYGVIKVLFRKVGVVIAPLIIGLAEYVGYLGTFRFGDPVPGVAHIHYGRVEQFPRTGGIGLGQMEVVRGKAVESQGLTVQGPSYNFV